MGIRRPRLDRTVEGITQNIGVFEQAPSWSFIIHCPHEGDLQFDFNIYRRHGREELASQMRDAFWSMRHTRTGRTLLSYRTHGLDYFWDFLDLQEQLGERITHLAQIDRSLIDRFLRWLDLRLATRGPTRGRPLSPIAKRTCFMHIKALLTNRLSLARSSVSPELTFPRNPYPNINKQTPSRQSYSHSEHKAIITALNSDLRTIHETTDEPLSDLQVLVVHIMVLALATGFNLQPLIELRRDSMSGHPITDRQVISATKRRAQSIQQASVRGQAISDKVGNRVSTIPASVADHFAFICEFTAPLLSGAAERDRALVFLWQVPKFKNKGRIERLNTTRLSNALRDFRQRHDLRDDRGQPLRLSIARLRPTMATDLYRRTGDIRHVQRALGHASPQTTAQRYAQVPLEAERNHALVLDHMVSSFSRIEIDGKALIAADGAVPDGTVRDLLSGGYNTGIARCRNPFREGDSVCHKYFTCFRCPNFCVFEDDLWRLFSFYERLLSERIKLNRTHWMKTYGPIVRRIDAEIAPLFPADKVEEARRRAREAPHPAWRNV